MDQRVLCEEPGTAEPVRNLSYGIRRELWKEALPQCGGRRHPIPGDMFQHLPVASGEWNRFVWFRCHGL